MGSERLPHDSHGAEGPGGFDAAAGGDPTPTRERSSVLAGDRPATGALAPPISVHLETNEVPFQQPDPRTIPNETEDRDWRAAVARVGRWPVAAMGAAAVLVVIFAAFIAANQRSPEEAGESVEQRSDFDSASAAATVGNTGERSQRAEAGSGGSDGSSGRSTGTVDAGEGSGYFSGQIIEPDESLTGSDVDFTPTTASTVAPPPTEASSTTTQPDSTVTTPSTATTGPEEPWVRPVGPGSPDAGNPTPVADGRVTLEAEGAGDDLRFRFTLSVETGDGWRTIARSRWRGRSTWTVDLRRLDGRLVRWTVVGRTGDREETPESQPLYLFVGDLGDPGDQGGDDDGEEEDAAPPVVQLSNGDFEQGVGGFDTFRNYSNGSLAGWSTSGVFEVWANGFNGVKAASGSYFLELNATGPTTITQQVAVSPGSDLRWSFRHRSRSGGDETVEVTVGPPGSGGTRFTASGNKWRTREGAVQVPAGVDRVQFSIRSVTGGSVGNFIDDVRIQAAG